MPSFATPAVAVLPLYDVLPGIVPVGRFLIRTQHLIVAVSHVSAYPSGCMLNMQISGRAGGHAPQLLSSEAVDQLVFVVRFGEDVTAVLDGWRHLMRNKGPLELGPIGGETGATATRLDGTRSMWLHPLPPAEPGTLSILAPDLGPQLEACALDGRAIAAAARQAQPY